MKSLPIIYTRWSLFTIYLQSSDAHYLFTVHLRGCKRPKVYQKFTEVYFVYEPTPKIWSEFVYGWFTASLPNNFDVRLSRFVYQNLVNEQP